MGSNHKDYDEGNVFLFSTISTEAIKIETHSPTMGTKPESGNNGYQSL